MHFQGSSGANKQIDNTRTTLGLKERSNKGKERADDASNAIKTRQDTRRTHTTHIAPTRIEPKHLKLHNLQNRLITLTPTQLPLQHPLHKHPLQKHPTNPTSTSPYNHMWTLDTWRLFSSKHRLARWIWNRLPLLPLQTALQSTHATRPYTPLSLHAIFSDDNFGLAQRKSFTSSERKVIHALAYSCPTGLRERRICNPSLLLQCGEVL